MKEFQNCLSIEKVFVKDSDILIFSLSFMKAYDMEDSESSSPQNGMMGAEELSILSRCISVELEIVDTSPCLMPNKAMGNMMSARKSKVRF